MQCKDFSFPPAESLVPDAGPLGLNLRCIQKSPWLCASCTRTSLESHRPQAVQKNVQRHFGRSFLNILTVPVIRAIIRPFFAQADLSIYSEVTIQGGTTHEKMQHVEKSMDCIVGRFRPSHYSKHGLRRRPSNCRSTAAAECVPGQVPGCCFSDPGPEITQ